MSEKEERMKAEAEAKQKLKANIAKRKEEARIKKEKEQKEAEEKAAKKAEEEKKLKEERQKKREEDIKRKKEEKAAEEQRKKQEEAAKAEELKQKRKESVQRLKEEAQKKREEEEKAKKEEEMEVKAKISLQQERIRKHRTASQLSKEEKQKQDEADKKKKAEEEEERIRLANEKIKQHREQIKGAREQREREEEEAKKREKEELEKSELALKEKLKLAREENRIKKEEAEKEEEARKEEEKKRELEAGKEFAEKTRKRKEELQKQRKEEEEKAQALKEQEEKELQAKEQQLKDNIKERKALVANQEEKKRLEKEEQKRLEQEKIQKAKAEQKRIIESNREESKRRKEEEKKKEQEQKTKQEEERKAKIAEKNKKRKEELKKQKALQEAEEKKRREEEAIEAKKKEEARKEAQKKRAEELKLQKQKEEEEEKRIRDEAEAKRIALEEEQKIALKKHQEEVKARMEEEKNLEEEEKEKLEKERAAEFEREQIKRKQEMESMIVEEEKRRKKADEKIRALGIKGPVNRCGLFSVFGEEPGLEIWVCGNDQISKIAKKKHGLRGLIGESHGSFHEERCYIILDTLFSQGFYNYRLHSWTGKQASADMKKQAEARLSELEMGLVNQELETITREYMEEESDSFKAYFEKELEYVRSVTLNNTTGPNFLEKSMYRMKGRNMVRCERVVTSPESLNSGDVFLLEDSFGLYQFNGKKSNKMERGKALDFGVQLRIERNARVKVYLHDEGNEQSIHEANKFWAALLLDRDETGAFILPEGYQSTGTIGETPTGLAREIASHDSAPNDEEYEQQYVSSWNMYEVRPSNYDQVSPPYPEDFGEASELEVVSVEISPKGPSVDQLRSWASLVLDCGSEIFVWYVDQSSKASRTMAKKKATSLEAEVGRPECVCVTKVRQRTEFYLFKEKFIGSWGEYADFDFTEEHIRGNIANLVQEEVNIDCMYHPEKYALASEDKAMPIPNAGDIDGDVSTDIYLVGAHDKIELERGEYGRFYSGNCYLMLIEISMGTTQKGVAQSRNIVYFWQGMHASREDKGLSALLAGDISKRLRFSQVVRVVQNKEPDHFLSHFNPCMVVSLGKRPDSKSVTNALYHLRGNSAINVKAIETSLSASALNSNDSFVLVSANKSIVWVGQGSNDFEKDIANEFAKSGKNQEIVKEGSETTEFFKIIGGKKEYASIAAYPKVLKGSNGKGVFFECTNTIGVFKVYRLEEYSQQDLNPKNCSILDVGNEIYVWMGSDSNEECQKMSMDTANKYLSFECEEFPKRSSDIQITKIQPGNEPVDFQSFFHSWDQKTAAASKDTYQSKLLEMKNSQSQMDSPSPQRRKK